MPRRRRRRNKKKAQAAPANATRSPTNATATATPPVTTMSIDVADAIARYEQFRSGKGKPDSVISLNEAMEMKLVGIPEHCLLVPKVPIPILMDQEKFDKVFELEWIVARKILKDLNKLFPGTFYAAGGACVWPFEQTQSDDDDGKTRDVDFFVVQNPKYKPEDMIQAFLHATSDTLFDLHQQLFDNGVDKVDTGKATVMLNGQTLTIRSAVWKRSWVGRTIKCRIVVQLILRGYPDVSTLLTSFDFAASQVAYDGETTWLTPLGIVSLLHGNYFDPKYMSRSTPHRLVKYFKRGHSIMCLGLSGWETGTHKFLDMVVTVDRAIGSCALGSVELEEKEKNKKSSDYAGPTMNRWEYWAVECPKSDQTKSGYDLIQSLLGRGDYTCHWSADTRDSFKEEFMSEMCTLNFEGAVINGNEVHIPLKNKLKLHQCNPRSFAKWWMSKRSKAYQDKSFPSPKVMRRWGFTKQEIEKIFLDIVRFPDVDHVERIMKALEARILDYLNHSPTAKVWSREDDITNSSFNQRPTTPEKLYGDMYGKFEGGTPQDRAKMLRYIEEQRCMCSICQNLLYLGDSGVAKQECGHVFHTKCVNRWIRMKGTEIGCDVPCPVCRSPIA